MPCIHAWVSSKLTPTQKTALKTRMGKAIEALPGKTEAWLMVLIEDDACLYFKGNQDAPSAYAEVSILGRDDANGYEKMTGLLCRIFREEAGIEPDRVYIKYSSTAHWGWNGSNF